MAEAMKLVPMGFTTVRVRAKTAWGCADPPFLQHQATDMALQREDMVKITTGAAELDKLLGGSLQ